VKCVCVYMCVRCGICDVCVCVCVHVCVCVSVSEVCGVCGM